MKVKIQKKIDKDLSKISDQGVLESFYVFIRKCMESTQLQDISHIKKLAGGKNYYRYRIREYRVGLRYYDDTLFIERMLHRKDIYKVFP